MPRCPHCDWEVRESDRFCSGDGRPLVRAHFHPTHIHQYVTDRDVYEGGFTVTNVGVNPLRLHLRASSEAVLVGQDHVVVAPNSSREFPITVVVGGAHTVREFIEVDSNESHPVVTRIPVVVSRPPQLQVVAEPGLLYFGESSECQVVVRHTGGGLCTITGGYFRDGWASVSVAGEATLASGDEVALPVTIDSRELPEGESTATLVLHLAGLGEQEFPVAVRMAKRPNIYGSAPRVAELLPGRVRTVEASVHNDSDEPVTIAHVRTQGGEWLRVADSLKLPYRLEPGRELRVKVEVRTHDRAGQNLAGSLTFQWDRDRQIAVPIRVRVLRPQEYEGYAGIDFGTTNSCVCVARPDDMAGTPAMVPLDFTGEGEPVYVIPTVVYFPNPDDLSEYLVGEHARVQTVIPSEMAHTVSRVKRRLGQQEPLEIHGQPVRPEAVAARILRYLLDRAEDFTRRIIKRAVVTVPADYSPAQMRAMLEACRLAGLEHAELQGGDLTDLLEQDLLDVLDEPLAAAVDYIYTPRGQDLVDDRFMVFDFGGGTLDVSLLHVKRGDGERATQLQVLAVEGREIGGEDFTDRLAVAVVEQLRAENQWSDVELPYEMDADEFEFLSPAQQQQVRYNRGTLLRLAEELKVQLSDMEAVERQIRVMAGYPARPVLATVRFSREALNALIEADIERSADLVQEALDAANTPAAAVSYVVLTGGTSRIPLVAETLRRRLAIPVLPADFPKECVARGAHLMGYQRQGVSTDTLRPVGLHNKTASRYGLLVNRTGMGAEFVEVVPKGQALPTPWFAYPDPENPAHTLPKAQRPVFEVPVVRNRSRQNQPGTASLQSLGKIRATVPGASPVSPVGVRVMMQVDRFKVLRVRVMAGEQQLEHTFSDV